MSQKSQDAIDVLSKVIVDTIDKKLDTANFDKSQTGVVTAVNGNTYTIAVFGSQYNITSDQIFTVGQSVVVTALQGDMKRLVSVNVVSEFEGAWLMDKDTSYYVGLEPKVTGVTRNQEAAVETTLSSKYPIVFYGSEANYYNGNFSGVIIKWDQSTDMFDFDGSVDYRETFIDWLTNKKPKVLKMYDGRAWLINVNGNVSYSDDEHPDKVEISFDFIETGDLNSSSDMKNAGLI